MSAFFERFLKHLESRYPETARAMDVKARLTPLLFCPEKVQLPKAIASEAQAVVRAFFNLRENRERAKRLEQLAPAIPDPGNFSVLMSYDFHVDEQGHLRLIEINTNASMSLMSELLYEVQGVANPFCTEFRREIMDCFFQEYALAFGGEGKPKTVAIIDEAPETQRLYVEFELYRELFTREGLNARLCDIRQMKFENGALLTPEGAKVDLVYNRETDFYFETRDPLRQAMHARAACITPHPHEYRLLADKERLLELSKQTNLDPVIERALIRTLEVKDFTDPDQLWAERKQWFFKTKNSYGGKAAYRGSSIGRPVFQQILAGPYLAQQYVAPPSIVAGGDEFKYDLRFFVYKDRIQLACARLYKGQMTNSQTPGGGVAAIEWV